MEDGNSDDDTATAGIGTRNSTSTNTDDIDSKLPKVMTTNGEDEHGNEPFRLDNNEDTMLHIIQRLSDNSTGSVRSVLHQRMLHATTTEETTTPVVVSTTTNIGTEENEEDNDVDDDEKSDSSTTSSSLSSFDSDSNDIENHDEMTLTQKRASNIERNHKLLSRLGMMHATTTSTAEGKSNHHQHHSNNNRTAAKKHSMDDDIDMMDSAMNQPRRGMLIPSCWSSMQREYQQQKQLGVDAFTQPPVSIHQSLAQINDRYPHRSTQIKKLYSLLIVPIHLAATTPVTTNFVAPPIIVTGPSGCGKTSIVRDIVRHISSTTITTMSNLSSSSSSSPQKQQNLPPPPLCVLHAYVDCTSLDHVSIDEMIASAYTQWLAQIPTAITSKRKTKRKKTTQTRNKHNDPPVVVMEERRVSRMRRAKLTNGHPQQQPTAVGGGHNTNENIVQQDLGPQSSSALTTILLFGRSIQRLLNRIIYHHHRTATTSTASSSSSSRTTNGKIPMFLVVDHAEVLLCMGTSYSKSTAMDRINLLVHLMLLPRTLNINLTIIFVTKNILLQHTALNNMNSQGTIQGHICPITIHFPAYRKKTTIQTILQQSSTKILIVGNGSLSSSAVTDNTFHTVVYKSFLETLVQGLFDFTSDIKEYIRLGRGLWPLYIHPLLPEHIDTTLTMIQNKNVSKCMKPINSNIDVMQRDILTALDQKFFPHLRYALEHGLGVLSYDSSGINTVSNRNQINNDDDYDDIPILAKYLIFAVYICHANRQEKDRQLFSIERNGRKRRKTKETDNDEEMAYGGSGQQQQHSDQPKTIRPRIFPMERLYSLYVSIVSLNASTGIGNLDDNNEMLRSLGNVQFLETIAYLRDIGILHDFPKRSMTEPIRFSQRNVWTSITRDEAQTIAKSILFPLDRYII